MTRRIACIVVLAVAVIGLFAWWLAAAPYFWTNIWWGFRASLFVWIPIAVIIVLGLGLIVFSAKAGPNRYGDSDFHLGRSILSWIIGIAAVIGGFWWATSLHSYVQANDYASSIHTTTDTIPDLGQRAPFQIAQAQAKPDLSGIEGADLSGETTVYLPQKGKFTTLVRGRATWGNYAAVLEQALPLAGHGAGSTCKFSSNATRVLGGWWDHNLGRLIGDQRRDVLYDDGDVYGYCDGNTPKVVVPLKQQVGWLVVTERPAGAAVYNGTTGDLTFADDASTLPGPSYPLSIAQSQRASTQGAGSYWDWWFNRVGYETTDANGEPDTNSSNSAEFTLPTSDGKHAYYTTPLTNRGSSTSISVISMVDVSEHTPGELAPLTVHTLATPWLSTSAIESRIKADYQDLPNWQTLQVDEVAPMGENRWVATIGNAQNILYRVRGTGDLSTAQGQANGVATCLYEGATDTPIRCGTQALVGSNGVGTQYGQTGPAGGGNVPGNIAGLSNDQLAQLQRQLADEIAKRLAVTTPGH